MKRMILTATAAAALIAGFAADARTARPGPPVPAAAASAVQLVTMRQAGMDMSAVVLGGIKAAVERGAPLKSQGFAARGLAKWAGSFEAGFAPSTASAPSHAKPEVWSDAAGFAARAATFRSAADQLAAAVAADNRPAFDSALAAVSASCKGCHDAYEQKAPAGG